MPPFMFQPMPTHPPVPRPLIMNVIDELLIVQFARKLPSEEEKDVPAPVALTTVIGVRAIAV